MKPVYQESSVLTVVPLVQKSRKNEVNNTQGLGRAFGNSLFHYKNSLNSNVLWQLHLKLH